MEGPPLCSTASPSSAGCLSGKRENVPRSPCVWRGRRAGTSFADVGVSHAEELGLVGYT